MIHIYTGDGKGKTTASVGLAARAVGGGLKVYYFQFLKDGSSSEIPMLNKIGAVTRCCPKCDKFIWCMTDEEKNELSAVCNDMLREINKLMKSGTADMIIIDEFFGAYTSGLIDIRLAEGIILSAENTELVLTGRNAPERFIKKADYVTEMTAVKNPYDKGIAARRGIEF